MTVQDNPYSEAPIFIATEDHDFMLPLSSKGIYLELPEEPPRTKSYRRVHILPVHQRISGVHRIVNSLRAFAMWGA